MMELLKIIHISCAALSLLGFITRYVLMLRDSPWLKHNITRRLPHVIDTLLLLSAIAMLVNWGVAPWAMPWLMAKLIALLVYIGLGFVALRLGASKGIRATAGITAILVFSYIVSVAISKNPLIF